jgi:hypothetical protein
MRVATLGLIAAAAIAIGGSANAQGVYIGAGPAGVGVGVHHDREWRRDYDREDRVVVREGRRHCRTVIIREDGMTRRIRRCR